MHTKCPPRFSSTGSSCCRPASLNSSGRTHPQRWLHHMNIRVASLHSQDTTKYISSEAIRAAQQAEWAQQLADSAHVLLGHTPMHTRAWLCMSAELRWNARQRLCLPIPHSTSKYDAMYRSTAYASMVHLARLRLAACSQCCRQHFASSFYSEHSTADRLCHVDNSQWPTDLL